MKIMSSLPLSLVLAISLIGCGKTKTETKYVDKPVSQSLLSEHEDLKRQNDDLKKSLEEVSVAKKNLETSNDDLAVAKKNLETTNGDLNTAKDALQAAYDNLITNLKAVDVATLEGMLATRTTELASAIAKRDGGKTAVDAKIVEIEKIRAEYVISANRVAADESKPAELRELARSIQKLFDVLWTKVDGLTISSTDEEIAAAGLKQQVTLRGEQRLQAERSLEESIRAVGKANDRFATLQKWVAECAPTGGSDVVERHQACVQAASALARETVSIDEARVIFAKELAKAETVLGSAQVERDAKNGHLVNSISNLKKAEIATEKVITEMKSKLETLAAGDLADTLSGPEAELAELNKALAAAEGEVTLANGRVAALADVIDLVKDLPSTPTANN